MSSPPKYQSLLLAGLAQSYASPGMLSLHSTRSQPGLFPASALGKAAAAAAMQSDWLQSVRIETKGKTTINYVKLTEAGSQYLLEQTDPKPLLDQVQSTLKAEDVRLQNVQAQVRDAFRTIEA